MIYRNQKEFKHVIRQLNSVQSIIQKKILKKAYPQFHSTPEHPIINFFRSLGYNITSTNGGIPDEIGYTQHHQLIGFELIKSPHQLVPHQSLKQAIQRSRYHGKITRSIIITDGIISIEDRHWARTIFSHVKLFDNHDLAKLSHQAQPIQSVSVAHHNYLDQSQILQKFKQRIINKQKRQKLNQQRNRQLKRAIQQINGFIPILTEFKNHFKKSVHQQNRFAHQLQKRLALQKRRRAALQAQRQAQNLKARLKAARGFANEIMNLI